MTDCGMCETPIEHGYLCPSDTRALADRLHRMPRLYTALAPFLTPAVRPGDSGGRTGRAHAPLPVSETVLDLRGPGGLVGVLERWWDAFLQDRYMLPPRIYGSIEGRIHRAARALTLNVPALAEDWPGTGPMAIEIRDVERSIASIVGAVDRPRGQRLGPCPAQHTDGSLCGAILRLPPGEQVVTCQWCGSSFPPATWAGLKKLIDHDQAAA